MKIKMLILLGSKCSEGICKIHFDWEGEDKYVIYDRTKSLFCLHLMFKDMSQQQC